MRFKKDIKILVVSICLMIFALNINGFSASYSSKNIAVNLNSKHLVLKGAQAYVDNGIVMVPLRSLSQALGANVSWDSSTNKIVILRGNQIATLKNGENFVSVNTKKINLKAPILVTNGTTFVSQDYIKTVFGFETSYDSTKSVLNIKVSEMPIHFSKSFRIKYLDNGCKLVTDGDSYKILLVPRGQTAPKGIVANKTVSIPLKSVMTGSSTFVGSMEKLGVLDSLKVVTTSEDYWYIPEVKSMLKQGKITYVGGDNMEAPNYEMVKALSPELAFMYTGDTGQQHVMKKLSEIGVKFAVNNEWLEPDSLGRMEWMKFIAAFYDKEFEAEKILNDAVKNINVTTSKVNGLSKPKVAWGLSWSGKIYITRPQSYVGKWITTCGGDYVFKNHKVDADTMVSAEYFYANAKDADVFIFSSTTNYMAEATIAQIVRENPLFANIKAVKNGNVYAYAPDWWQTIPETDIFMKDIAAVFHPEAFPGYKPVKLIKLPLK